MDCFFSEKKPAQSIVPITLIVQTEFDEWLAQQKKPLITWLSTSGFRAEAGQTRLFADHEGRVQRVFSIVTNLEHPWGIAHLPLQLAEGKYELELGEDKQTRLALGWGLGAYQFTRYKEAKRKAAQLYLPAAAHKQVSAMVSSIYLVRDWINTPAEDMGPSEFAQAAKQLAQQEDATFKQIIGEDLMKHHYPCIYTVGRASDDAPRLLDLRWGKKQHPKVTLVGKGVCFDSGGLDIKSSSYMQLMKKDMAGAAHVLGLARMIMQAQLPICLRILIPVVENAISGNAYRPGDIIKSRKGLTIEIGNTDAEGRVILADALTEAVSEQPELLIDIASLTGAARVALGTELPAVFSNNDALVNAVMTCANKHHDPIWRLPLFALYREHLNSQIADINNNSSEPYGGAISAALFLKEFVPDDIPWLHFDLMAWNLRARPGRPQGGEAMALRALFAYLCEQYG
jgi:leucyl aminopeptidase